MDRGTSRIDSKISHSKKDCLNGVDTSGKDGLANFDIPTLLREGILAWSYDGGLPSDCEDPSDLLDEKTAVWAANEIVAITRPPTEEEEGKS